MEEKNLNNQKKWYGSPAAYLSALSCSGCSLCPVICLYEQ